MALIAQDVTIEAFVCGTQFLDNPPWKTQTGTLFRENLDMAIFPLPLIQEEHWPAIYLFFILFIQCFKRVTCLAVIAILPCGPLCKHIYIYKSNIITS